MIDCRSTADLKTKFTELTKFLRPELVLEIGAREAEYSKEIGQAFSDSKVFASSFDSHCDKRCDITVVRGT